MNKLALALTLLFCMSPIFVSVRAGELPPIAVYVTGNVGENEKNALGTQMLVALLNSGRYRGIERAAAFRAEIERELQTQHSGMIDDDQISALGRQFGVRYICIADITPAFGTFQVSARIINVETAEVVSIGAAHGRVQSMDELVKISNDVVRSMFGITTDNFTPNERALTLVLNLIPSLGSFLIMEDHVGGWWQVGLVSGGIVLVGTGYAIENSTDARGLAIGAAITGAACILGSYVFNIVRSISYDKPAPRTALGANGRFDFAIFPNQNGNLTAYAGYRLEF